MMAAYSGFCILSTLIKLKKTCKSLTPSDKFSGSEHASKLFDTDGMIKWVFSNISISGYIGFSSGAVVSRLIID